MKDSGFIRYLRDEVLLRNKSVSILIYGNPGYGKTMSGAIPLAMKLDPTFLKNVEERYIVGDQYDKLAHYYMLPNEYTRGKAFVWDEIGIGAFSESHSERIVKWLTKAGQISRIKYAFFIAVVPNPKMVTSNVRNQYEYLFEAIDKKVKTKPEELQGNLTAEEVNKRMKGETVFRVRKNVMVVHHVKFGEPKITYFPQMIYLPPEYREGPLSQYSNVYIDKYTIRLPPYNKIKKVYQLEDAWKTSFNKRSAEEMMKVAPIGNKDDVYAQIANKIIMNFDEYSKGKYVKKLDREKIFAVFNLTSSSEFNKIRALVEKYRIQHGYNLSRGGNANGIGENQNTGNNGGSEGSPA